MKLTLEKLEEHLKSKKEFLDDESQLLKDYVCNLATDEDKDLISHLLLNEEIRTFYMIAILNIKIVLD